MRDLKLGYILVYIIYGFIGILGAIGSLGRITDYSKARNFSDFYSRDDVLPVIVEFAFFI